MIIRTARSRVTCSQPSRWHICLVRLVRRRLGGWANKDETVLCVTRPMQRDKATAVGVVVRKQKNAMHGCRSGPSAQCVDARLCFVPRYRLTVRGYKAIQGLAKTLLSPVCGIKTCFVFQDRIASTCDGPRQVTAGVGV